MFSWRHYEALAQVLRDSHPGAGLSADNRAVVQWSETIKDVAEMLERDNSRFDIIRFVKACRPAVGQNTGCDPAAMVRL